MAYLIHRDSVQKKKVVRALSTVDIQPRHQFSPGIYTGQVLYGLYKVRGTEDDIAVQKIHFIEPTVPCLTFGYIFLSVSCNPCFRYAVPSLIHLQ